MSSMAKQRQFDYESLYSRLVPAPAARSYGERVPYDFAVGHPDPDSFPVEELIASTHSVMLREGKDLARYPGNVGYDGLRQVIVDKLQQEEGLAVSLREIVITNGSMQAINMVAQTFIDPGDMVMTEDFTYLGALRLFERYGPRIMGIPMDEQGIRTDALEDSLQRMSREGMRPKFIYVIVNYQNPVGVCLSLERRRELLRLAESYKFAILEDDSYGDLRYEGEFIPSLYSLSQSDLVMRVGTLSKIVAAGVRLGWLMAPERIMPRLLTAKIDGGTNSFASRVAAEYLKEHLEHHVQELIGIYRHKRDTMLKALEEHFSGTATWTHPSGGFYIWLQMPQGIDTMQMLEEARKAGVSYIPGPLFSPSRSGANCLRLSFAYMSTEDIPEGIRRLAEAMRQAKPIAAVSRVN